MFCLFWLGNRCDLTQMITDTIHQVPKNIFEEENPNLNRNPACYGHF